MGIAGAVFWAAAVISARFGMSLYMPVVVGLGVAVGFFKINNYVSIFDDNAEYRAKWETKTKLLDGFSLQIPMDENNLLIQNIQSVIWICFYLDIVMVGKT